MKVLIGSRYTGPAFDRPCLRQMPREWSLATEQRRALDWWTKGDRWIAIACAVLAVVAVVDTVWRLFA